MYRDLHVLRYYLGLQYVELLLLLCSIEMSSLWLSSWQPQ